MLRFKNMSLTDNFYRFDKNGENLQICTLVKLEAQGESIAVQYFLNTDLKRKIEKLSLKRDEALDIPQHKDGYYFTADYELAGKVQTIGNLSKQIQYHSVTQLEEHAQYFGYQIKHIEKCIELILEEVEEKKERYKLKKKRS